MTEGNSMTGQLSAENLAIVRSHLLNAGHLEIDEREALRSWHTRLTVQAAMNALESLDPTFFSILLEGHRMNSQWSLSFFAEFFSALPGFLARGGRTRSQMIQRL